MEFNFSVNALFKEKIIKVQNNLVPDTHVPDRHGDGDVVSKISTILDKMGVVSTKAQNLPRTLTSATKLRNSDHVVYFLADPKGNKGHGSVVGLLKVGRKKLFVYDKAGNQLEMEPLCVLDFYTHESKQRTGCGHLLFDYMLQDQKVEPQHLALDQPSGSFLNFMTKHYGLDTICPQNNGFVVYETFFKDRAGGENIRSPRVGNLNKNPVHTVNTSSRSGHDLPIFGRHSAKKAETTMGQYMHDDGQQHFNGKRGHDLPGHDLPIFGRHSAKKAETTMGQYMHDDGQQHFNGKSSGELLSWTINQHRVPLAQYGQYWSSVGQLLEEYSDEEEATDGPQTNTVHHRVRKVSNIPIGNTGLQDDDEELGMDLDYLPNGYNGNSTTTRDVRFKKTTFQNLSPFRR